MARAAAGAPGGAPGSKSALARPLLWLRAWPACAPPSLLQLAPWHTAGTRLLPLQGHVVMRYHCPLKEQRRHRIFEKCFDVAATSPYSAPVRQWLLVGYDNGARIAAGGECLRVQCRGGAPSGEGSGAGMCDRAGQAGRPAAPPQIPAAAVGAKLALRAPVAGYVLLSYPLLQPAPPPPKQRMGTLPPADSSARRAALHCSAPPALMPPRAAAAAELHSSLTLHAFPPPCAAPCWCSRCAGQAVGAAPSHPVCVRRV